MRFIRRGLPPPPRCPLTINNLVLKAVPPNGTVLILLCSFLFKPASLSRPPLLPIEVVVMNIFIFQSFDVIYCSRLPGAKWGHMKRDLSMYLFWTTSVSPGLSACSYSHCRIVEITNPAESPAIPRQSSHYKPREKNKDHKRRGDRSSDRGREGGRNSLSVSRSPHKYCNCAVTERRRCEPQRCD